MHTDASKVAGIKPTENACRKVCVMTGFFEAVVPLMPSIVKVLQVFFLLFFVFVLKDGNIFVDPYIGVAETPHFPLIKKR